MQMFFVSGILFYNNSLLKKSGHKGYEIIR
jgi:hypothetical protein